MVLIPMYFWKERTEQHYCVFQHKEMMIAPKHGFCVYHWDSSYFDSDVELERLIRLSK